MLQSKEQETQSEIDLFKMFEELLLMEHVHRALIITLFEML